MPRANAQTNNNHQGDGDGEVEYHLAVDVSADFVAHEIIIKDSPNFRVAVRCQVVSKCSLRTTDHALAVVKIVSEIALFASWRFGVVALADFAFRVTAETLARNLVAEVAVGALGDACGAQFKIAWETRETLRWACGASGAAYRAWFANAILWHCACWARANASVALKKIQASIHGAGVALAILRTRAR